MPDTLTIVVPDAMLRAALATALVDLGHRLEGDTGQARFEPRKVLCAANGLEVADLVRDVRDAVVVDV